jgi:hypothetical protein
MLAVADPDTMKLDKKIAPLDLSTETAVAENGGEVQQKGIVGTSSNPSPYAQSSCTCRQAVGRRSSALSNFPAGTIELTGSHSQRAVADWLGLPQLTPAELRESEAPSPGTTRRASPRPAPAGSSPRSSGWCCNAEDQTGS